MGLSSEKQSESGGGTKTWTFLDVEEYIRFFSNIPFCVCFVTYFFFHENGPCFFASTKSKIAAGE